MNTKFVNKAIVAGLTLATMGSGLVGFSTAYAEEPQVEPTPVVKKETPKKKSFSEIAHQVQTYDAAALHPNATQEELDKLYPTTKDSKSKVTVKDVKEVKEQIENKTYGKDPTHVPTVHEMLPDVNANQVVENAGKLNYPDMKEFVAEQTDNPTQDPAAHPGNTPVTPTPAEHKEDEPATSAKETPTTPEKAEKAKLPQTSDPLTAVGAVSSISGFLALAGSAFARKRMK